MVDNFGSITLNIQEYERTGAQINLTEQALIPAPGDTTPQSVLMGTGRLRRRVRISGWLNPADYDALEADKEALTSRTLTLNSADPGFSMNAYIEDLRMTTVTGADIVLFDAMFVEA